ncbi:MAG TPA: Type 1 glutamine amidotransferase-like domain-containing protein [Symbiobacteriaceae bacterium]|jgi:cyanophycinase
MVHLLPIGGGRDPGPLAYFAARAAVRDTDGVIELRVLPATYASDPLAISPAERQERLLIADDRRADLEEVCRQSLPGRACRVRLLPVLVREDARAADNVALLGADVDGVICLGGDQMVAMRVLAGTPLEAALAERVADGVPFCGSSAGATIQSRTMLAGASEGFGPAEGLRAGGLEIWPAGGLKFGARKYIIDQHLYQRGRLGRLIHAVAVTGLTGLGLDRDTGVHLQDEVVTAVFGPSGAVIVEPPQTWAYGGPNRTLGGRGFVTHLLGPGCDPYDPGAVRRPPAGRDFACLRAPAGAGPLILACGAEGLFPGVFALPPDGEAAGVAVARWRAGEPLLLPDPALAGAVRCPEPAPAGAEAVEAAAIRWFRAGSPGMVPGLGLLPGVAFESDLLHGKRWGRLYGVAAAHPGLVAVGLERGTLLVVGPDGARVAGAGAVVVVDGRNAAFSTAENGVLAVRGVRIDIFVDGEEICP